MEGMFGGRGCRYRTGRVSLRLRSWIAARLIGRRGVGRRGQDSPAPARRKCVTRNTGAAGLGSWRLLVHLPAAYPLSPEVGGVAGHARHSHAGRKEKPPPRRRREVLLRLLGLSGRQCREYFNTPTARLTRTYSGLARRPRPTSPVRGGCTGRVLCPTAPNSFSLCCSFDRSCGNAFIQCRKSSSLQLSLFLPIVGIPTLLA